jgi:ABC-type Fe3+-citrate transport system substrate-binding protein
MKYICKCCDYSTEDKSNFNKHITSRKHKLVESKSKSISPTLVENYHENIIQNLIELIRTMNERLEKQEKQLNEQKLQIDTIISEIF